MHCINPCILTQHGCIFKGPVLHDFFLSFGCVYIVQNNMCSCIHFKVPTFMFCFFKLWLCLHCAKQRAHVLCVNKQYFSHYLLIRIPLFSLYKTWPITFKFYEVPLSEIRNEFWLCQRFLCCDSTVAYHTLPEKVTPLTINWRCMRWLLL